MGNIECRNIAKARHTHSSLTPGPNGKAIGYARLEHTLETNQ